VGGAVQPGPAPRFSKGETDQPRPPRPAGADAEALLGELGYSDGDIAQLRSDGALL
jgi:alpha-methylacyl-CoA racemase